MGRKFFGRFWGKIVILVIFCGGLGRFFGFLGVSFVYLGIFGIFWEIFVFWEKFWFVGDNFGFF